MIKFADRDRLAVVQVVAGDPQTLGGRPLRCVETGTEYELTGIGLQKPFEYDSGIYMVTLRSRGGAGSLQPGMTLIGGDDA